MGFASHASEQEDAITQAGFRTKTSFVMITVITNSTKVTTGTGWKKTNLQKMAKTTVKTIFSHMIIKIKQ